ncbi:MAG: heavy metal translocating P-type ATPase [Candidatus Cloacimonadia bacterium]
MANDIRRITVDIEGMTCASCSGGVEGTLRNMEGVTEANVNFANGKALVSFQPEIIKVEQILDMIDQLGYKAKLGEDLNDNTEKVILQIKGMSCVNCSGGIEKKLKETAGITEVHINFANEKGTIIFDRKQIKLSEIRQIIANLGYESTIAEDEEEQDDSLDYVKMARNKMIYSSILAGIVMILMIFKMAGFVIPYYHLITVLLGFPVVFIIGFGVHKSSWLSLKNRAANMDVLVSLGSLPPFLVGLAGFFFDIQTFVEMATTIMTFHLVGKYLENRAKGRSSEAIKKLIHLGAKTASIERDGEVIEVSVKELEVGDIMVVKPGEKIPIDGIIIEGTSSIDESMVSGESMPVTRTVGEEVIGATINKQGFLKVKVAKTGKDTFLSQVIKLVEECQGSKVPIQEFADRVTGYFVPVILGLTALTFLSHWLFPEFHRSIIEWGATFLPWVNPAAGGLTLAFITATAVLVIACPCALGLGTPTALMVGSGLGAEHGILIRSGEAVQTLREIKAIAFDKTGTITHGKPEVTDVKPFNNFSVDMVIFYSATLEKASEHPLGTAVIAYAEERKVKLSNVTEVEAIPGKGIVGTVDGKRVYAGNRKLLSDHGIDFVGAESTMNNLENEAKTLLLIALDGQLIGVIAVADKIKEDSKQAIKMLDELGIVSIMVTGDNRKTAEAIAKLAGIKQIAAEVLPEGKVNEVIKLQEKYGLVAMVGDGINDAPALKQANVGIALGTGTDIAIEAADVTLIRNELVNVVSAIKLSQAIFRKIKENFFWAWFYNVIAVPIAMLGLLHPMIGAAAMSFSSLNVIYNSLRLKKMKLG